MKTFSRIMLLFTFVIYAGYATAQSLEQDINRVEDQRYDALINADWAALEAFLAEEFIYHQPNGNITTKASFIALMKTGEIKLRKAVRKNVKVRPYGDVAVVTGDTDIDLVNKGEERKIQLRYLNVWVKRDKGWQLAARQSAFVQPPK